MRCDFLLVSIKLPPATFKLRGSAEILASHQANFEISMRLLAPLSHCATSLEPASTRGVWLKLFFPATLFCHRQLKTNKTNTGDLALANS